jgi:hypothetical protein
MAEYKDITKLKKEISDVKRELWESSCQNRSYITGYVSALSYVEGMIASLPAANVQPKHGHWSKKLIYNKFASCIGSMMICSECNKDNKYDKRMDYCPNCGAKMDGKEA